MEADAVWFNVLPGIFLSRLIKINDLTKAGLRAEILNQNVPNIKLEW